MGLITTNNSIWRRHWKLASAVIIGLCSTLLISGCGNKEGAKPSETPASKPSSSGSPNIAQTIVFFEDALPGNPLIFSATSNTAFKTMSENLSGVATITIVDQKSYDYTITPSPSTVYPKVSRQEGRTANPVNPTIKGRGIGNFTAGNLSLNISTNPTEPARAFIYQPQMNVFGIVLTSTDRVALFKAANPAPFIMDFVKIYFESKNPNIQRFKISQLSPFPMFGWNPQLPGNRTRSNWINVINQTLSTAFQYPAK
ncbi:MAG: hypothetical protein EBR01_00545 [Proteobacteria bacterium]|nr:hypothetical protein [Pseudomonadota bacterium]